jgi:ubiquinone/menaquinone biosynthesis C-methylase UbiE
MFTDPKKNIEEFGFIPGQKVVDLGAGSGHYTKALSSSLGVSGRVIAVDNDKEILIKLKNECLEDARDNVEIVLGDIQASHGTRLKDGYADGAILSNILFQLTDIKGALEEAKRILKTGGKVGVVEWFDLSLVSPKNGSQRKPVTEIETKKHFAESGFVFERSFNAGENHYGLIFKKPLQ